MSAVNIFPQQARPGTYAYTEQVASIFPLERRLHKPTFKPQSMFIIPAVPKGNPPFILDIHTQTENVFIGGARAGFGGNYIDKPIPAYQIAQDFATHHFIIGAARDANGVDGSPGVWHVGTVDTDVAIRIRELTTEVQQMETEQRNPPGQAEIRQEINALESQRFGAEVKLMTYKQGLFFEQWFKLAELLAVRNKPEQITDMSRIGAAWHGITGRSWQQEMAKEMMKPCPYCRALIDGLAVVCPICSKTVDQQRYAAMMAEEKRLIMEAEKEMRRRAKEQAEAEKEAERIAKEQVEVEPVDTEVTA